MIFLFVWIFFPLCPQDKGNSFKNKEFSKLSSRYYKQSEASSSGPWNDSLEESAFSPNLNGKKHKNVEGKFSAQEEFAVEMRSREQSGRCTNQPWLSLQPANQAGQSWRAPAPLPLVCDPPPLTRARPLEERRGGHDPPQQPSAGGPGSQGPLPPPPDSGEGVLNQPPCVRTSQRHCLTASLRMDP